MEVSLAEETACACSSELNMAIGWLSIFFSLAGMPPQIFEMSRLSGYHGVCVVHGAIGGQERSEVRRGALSVF